MNKTSKQEQNNDNTPTINKKQGSQLHMLGTESRIITKLFTNTNLCIACKTRKTIRYCNVYSNATA